MPDSEIAEAQNRYTAYGVLLNRAVESGYREENGGKFDLIASDRVKHKEKNHYLNPYAHSLEIKTIPSSPYPR